MKGRVQRCLSWHPRDDDGVEEVRVARPDLLPGAVVEPLHLPNILGASPCASSCQVPLCPEQLSVLE